MKRFALGRNAPLAGVTAVIVTGVGRVIFRRVGHSLGAATFQIGTGRTGEGGVPGMSQFIGPTMVFLFFMAISVVVVFSIWRMLQQGRGRPARAFSGPPLHAMRGAMPTPANAAADHQSRVVPFPPSAADVPDWESPEGTSFTPAATPVREEPGVPPRLSASMRLAGTGSPTRRPAPEPMVHASQTRQAARLQLPSHPHGEESPAGPTIPKVSIRLTPPGEPRANAAEKPAPVRVPTPAPAPSPAASLPVPVPIPAAEVGSLPPLPRLKLTQSPVPKTAVQLTGGAAYAASRGA